MNKLKNEILNFKINQISNFACYSPDGSYNSKFKTYEHSLDNYSYIMSEENNSNCFNALNEENKESYSFDKKILNNSIKPLYVLSYVDNGSITDYFSNIYKQKETPQNESSSIISSSSSNNINNNNINNNYYYIKHLNKKNSKYVYMLLKHPNNIKQVYEVTLEIIDINISSRY